MLATSTGVAHSYVAGMNDMNTIESVKKAFRESRIAGEQMLSQGKITWDEYAATMVGYELVLKSMGVSI